MNVSLNSVQVLSLLIGTVLPLLVGLVTKQSTHPAVKSTLLAALSVLTGFLTEWQHAALANTAYNWKAGALTAVLTFAVGIALHLGFWKNIGVTQAVQNSWIKDTPKIVGTIEGSLGIPNTGGGFTLPPTTGTVPEEHQSSFKLPD